MEVVQNRKLSILVIDDDKAVLRVLQHLLEYESYEVYTAINAVEGLKLLENNAIDLIIADYSMPQMDGVEFFKIVKDAYPETIRFMLTGKAGYDEAVRAINNGEVYRFINKPFDPVELKAMIQFALENKREIDITAQKTERLARMMEESNELLRDIAKTLKKRNVDRKVS